MNLYTMKKLFAFLFLIPIVFQEASAQEFLSHIKLPKSHDLIDFAAANNMGIYVLSGNVGNGNIGMKSTREITLHFFDTSLNHKWSVGIFEKVENWATDPLRILVDSSTSDVGLVVYNEQGKLRSIHAVSVDRQGKAKFLEHQFPDGTKNIKIHGALISEFGIHVFCETNNLKFSECYFSFSEHKSEIRHTFEMDAVNPEFIGRSGNILFIQDPVYVFCLVHRYNLKTGEEAGRHSVSPSKGRPSFLLRPTKGSYIRFNQYSVDTYTSLGSNGQTSTTYSYSANGGAYISLQWLSEKQRFVSFELHGDTVKNRKKVSRRNYYIDGFIIREFDASMQQVAYHYIPLIESLKNGKTRMNRIGAYDSGYGNTFCLSLESDSTYLISAFDIRGKWHNLIRVNADINQITEHQALKMKRVYSYGFNRGERETRAISSYSTINVNHYPSYFHAWLKKKNYLLNSSKGINSVFEGVQTGSYYFVHNNKNLLSLSIWSFSENGQVTAKSLKLESPSEFLVKE